MEMPPKFLSLPLEIRQEIYSQLHAATAADRAHRDIHDPEPWQGDLPGWFDLGFSPGLSRSCCQVYNEYRNHFFGKATLHTIVRVFASETDFFRSVLQHFPSTVMDAITKCSVIILWKPRNVRRKPLSILRNELEVLQSGLQALRSLEVEFRYFDIHDLESDIERAFFEVGEFWQLQSNLNARLPSSKLCLSAITSLLTQNARRSLDREYRERELEWLLLVETYVSWRFEHASAGDGKGWYGMLPAPCSFFCYGLEAPSIEVLRALVKAAIEEEIDETTAAPEHVPQ